MYAASFLRFGIDEIATRLIDLTPDAVRKLQDKVEMRPGHAARLVAHVRQHSALKLAWALDSLFAWVPRGGVPGCVRGCLDVT
jgi:hypothetical protein